MSFVNTNKEFTETEVPQDTFLAMQEFSRKRESISRSDRRHIERSEQTEISLNVKYISKQLSIDETTIRNIRNSDLHQAISKLTQIQQRRVRMYFFEGQKLREIAVYENCSPQAVHKMRIFIYINFYLLIHLNNLLKFRFINQFFTIIIS